MARLKTANTDTKKAGTGKVDGSKETTAEKWIDETSATVNNQVELKDILAKTIPISDITPDPDNPRNLKINKKMCLDIYAKFPTHKTVITADDTEWIEDYVIQTADEFDLEGKQLGDLRSILKLAYAIKTPDRLVNPITVWLGGGRYNLIAGERRLLAHIFMGVPAIASRITDTKPTPEEIAYLKWSENVHREDMNLHEKLTSVKEMVLTTNSLETMSVRKLAKFSGMSNTEASRYLCVLKYPDPILMNAIKDGEIESLQLAVEFSKLSAQEIEDKLNRVNTKKLTATKPKVRVTREADTGAIAKILSAVAEKYDLDSLLDEFDLNKTKDLNRAFNKILEVLENK